MADKSITSTFLDVIGGGVNSVLGTFTDQLAAQRAIKAAEAQAKLTEIQRSSTFTGLNNIGSFLGSGAFLTIAFVIVALVVGIWFLRK